MKMPIHTTYNKKATKQIETKCKSTKQKKKSTTKLIIITRWKEDRRVDVHLMGFAHTAFFLFANRHKRHLRKIN